LEVDIASLWEAKIPFWLPFFSYIFLLGRVIKY
jgi:hypothetical protein